MYGGCDPILNLDGRWLLQPFISQSAPTTLTCDPSMRASAVLYPLLVCASAEGFTARSKAVFHPHRKWHLPTTPPPLRSHPELGADGGTADADRRTHQETGPAAPGERLLWAAAAPAALALWTASPAEAADVVPSALWAYGHYLSMLLAMGALVAERVLIKPEMSSDEEKALRLADLAYVGSLVFLIVTGSLRATEVCENAASVYLSYGRRLSSPLISLSFTATCFC